ncbi:hypothetical protein [Candidatus Uabimicrobium amorphum]|uniref:Uncharacterized protein n=1 Tax=Uabimicrobium amorphum TaxID=2596890 RepID=A0A5S9F316_UABAM|nr:hypothetical protein [Candidatus Uabimicrobium amorphum]BBM83791.1 hypothetical protein UABAM_02146 [Candidatus Uabimicrobium amorphum]
MSTDPSKGIQLKDGSFTFPTTLKCRVDRKALKAIPRNFEICKQGIEALNDLFYEAPPEKKEGVLVQKSIWENVEERIQNVQVFNAGANYTDLTNQTLPIRVNLPKGSQSYPLDQILTKDLSNPYLEMKKFARELLDVVAAIRALREEKLFKYDDFFIYPGKEAFVLTDNESGERHLNVAIHSICPDSIAENTSSEELCLMAIKDLIRQRWDFSLFNRVLKANDLQTAFAALRHLSRDVPTLERIAVGTGYAAVYALIGFVAFSILMFFSGLTPWNNAELQSVSYQFYNNDGEALEVDAKSTVVSSLKRDKQDKKKYNEVDSYRIVLNRNDVSGDVVEMVGTYESPLRLEQMGGLFIFDKLGLSKPLDQVYGLNKNKPIALDQLKYKELDMVKAATKEFESNGKKITSRFIIKSQKKWGRERFDLAPSSKEEKSLPLEVIVAKKGWKLSSQPTSVTFKQTQDEKTSSVSEELRVFANPPKGSKEKSAEINKRAFFRVTFKNPDLPTVPIEIQYLKSPKGPVVATVSFSETYYNGGLPTTRSVRIRTRRSRDFDEDDEEDDEDFDEDEDEDEDRPRRGRLSRRDPDVFQLNGHKYYALAQLPEFTTVKIANKQLPSEDIECSVHIAVPGIEKTTEIPITFNPKEDFLFKEDKMVHVRNQVSGLAYPIEIQKRLWNRSPRKLEAVRLADFTYEINDGQSKQPLDNYGAMGIGFQIQSDRTLYFYNPKDGKTNAIENYTVKDNVLYFAANEDNYKANESGWFQPTKENLNAVNIRRQTAEAITQLYVVVLTDKNVENAMLTLKRNKRTELELPISAKSEEALKIVTWRQLAPNQTYKKEDWLNQEDPKDQKVVNINGPLGGLRYNVILFAGDEAVADVSNQAYLKIEDSSVLNMIYQTVDSDWFTYNKSDIDGIKSLNKPAVQLKFLKRSQDKRPPYTLLDHKEIGSVATKDLYFLADQDIIGKVVQYYAVAGSGVKAGEKDKKTKLTFYLPEKDMEASIEVNVSRAAEHEVMWDVKLNQEDKTFSISVQNYKTANADSLAKEMRFLLTCAATQLVHSGYHKSEGQVYSDDARWAKIIAWALQSVGTKTPSAPPTDVLGTLAEELGTSLGNKEEFATKLAYQLMREALFLAWSGKSEDLLNDFLGLTGLEEDIAAGKKVANDYYTLDVEFYPTRVFPILVDSPTRFKSVTFKVPFDKVLLDKTAIQLHELNESYYRGVPTHFDAVPRVKSYLGNIYPHSDAFPEQKPQNVGSGIQISEKLYHNLLQYSLWEERLKNSVKPKSKFWVAIQGISREFTDVDGKINLTQMNNIADEFRKRIESYLLSPVEVRRVFWQELQNKVRTPEERDKNRDGLSKQEQEGLLDFVERSMMPQFTVDESWYSSFEIVIDRQTLDKCPFGSKWVYMKTYRPQADGLQGEVKKIKLFKRNGLSLDPWPSQDYKVEIFNYGDNWAGNADTKIVRVTGVDAYTAFYEDHTSSEVKGGPDKRIRLDIFYEDRTGEKKIARAGDISPPVIDFSVHPKSVVLFEVSGYQISPDRLREVMRTKGLEMYVKRGTKNWKWNFSVDNGPVISPYAFNIQATEMTENKETLELSWKEEPEPASDSRSFTALQENYDMELLYLDANEKLPEEKFFPYRDYANICGNYDEGKIQSRRMFDLLNKLFANSSQLKSSEKFEWSEELAEVYDKKHTLENNNVQMFQYKYDESHVITTTIYENIYAPEVFKGKHPQLKVPASPTESAKRTLIWKISPKEGKSLRGFPKYILQKQLVPTRERIISNE